MLTQEARALHDVWADQGWCNQRNKACFERTIQSEVHQGKLEACTNSAEEVEASARNLGATSHVNSAEALPQLEVILGFKVEGRNSADLTQGDEVVFTAGRNAFDDGVLNLAGSVGISLICSGCCSVGFFHPGGKLSYFSEKGLLFIALCLADLLAEHVLFCAQLFEGCQRSTAISVCLQGNVYESWV